MHLSCTCTQTSLDFFSSIACFIIKLFNKPSIVYYEYCWLFDELTWIKVSAKCINVNAYPSGSRSIVEDTLDKCTCINICWLLCTSQPSRWTTSSQALSYSPSSFFVETGVPFHTHTKKKSPICVIGIIYLTHQATSLNHKKTNCYLCS